MPLQCLQCSEEQCPCAPNAKETRLLLGHCADTCAVGYSLRVRCYLFAARWRCVGLLLQAEHGQTIFDGCISHSSEVEVLGCGEPRNTMSLVSCHAAFSGRPVMADI